MMRKPTMSLPTISLRSWTLPFVHVLGGVISDYLTTIIGLGMGFCEMNPKYNPVLSLLVFLGITAMLTLIVPRKKPWILSLNGIAIASYLGAINNAMVILGLLSF